MSLRKYNFRSAAYLILREENKVLLIRRFNTGWMDGMYSLPAGHIDGNETVQMAMSREAKEEIDIDISPEDLSISHMMHRRSPDVEYMDFYLETKKYTGTIKNMEENKCNEINWFPIDSLPENTLDYIKEVFRFISEGKSFSSFGF